MILDLRNDPGGLLDQAIKVSDIFLKEGYKYKLKIDYILSIHFLHNNIEHAVNKVKNDFERYTLIRFINRHLK